jgi:phosphoglycolate phosphatase
LQFYNKELIIFDFDGTLIDSVPDLANAVNHMLTSLQRDTFSEESIRYWVGNGAETLVARALSANTKIDANLDKELLQTALDIFLKYYEKNVAIHTVTYPEVTNTLKTLKEQNYNLAIVTNKPFKFIDPILKSLKLDSIFDLCIGADSLEVKKPHPEPLLHVCDKLGIHPDNSLMVGDSKNDILAANSANMPSIAVTYGYNYGEDISKYDPSVVIDNFSEILKVLK